MQCIMEYVGAAAGGLSYEEFIASIEYTYNQHWLDIHIKQNIFPSS